MVGRKIFGQVLSSVPSSFRPVVRRMLFGDFGQLPLVMDLPLYTTVTRTALLDLGSSAYQLVDQAMVLDQVMRQSGHFFILYL